MLKNKQKKKKKKKELIRKIKVYEIGQINMNDYLEIPGTRTFRNARNVTQEMADKIEYAKYLINKNISDDIKRDIDFSSNTTFEIWNTLRHSYYPSVKEQKSKH
jgi:hypothetical protein